MYRFEHFMSPALSDSRNYDMFRKSTKTFGF